MRRTGDGAREELRGVFEQAHEGVRVLQHACWNHFRRAFVAEKENWQAVVATTLGREHFLQDLPLRAADLRAVDGYEPARFTVEHLDQAPRVLIAYAGDNPESLLLYGAGQLAHATPGCMLTFKVLIDDGNGKCLEKFHLSFPAS